MMTDLEMNQAIRGVCGWEWSVDGGYWQNAKRPGHKYHEPPDYPNDLNAMHEAEKVLPNEKLEDWINWMGEICNPRVAGGWKDFVPLVRATAKQRAEAMCRTLFPERFKE